MVTRALHAYAEVALGRQRSPAHDLGPHMVPYLRAANVKDGRLDLTDVKEMNFSPSERKRFALRDGDVLVTEGSGSLGAVGASAVWRGEVEGSVCFQNTLLRLRPRQGVDSRFLAWWCRHAFADGVFASVATGANIFHISAERVRALPVSYIPLKKQRAIADYLDTETGRVDALISKKQSLLDLLDERIDTMISATIEASALVEPTRPALEIRRVLSKRRVVGADGHIVTAFRDGQVTARVRRRAEGYTESWTENSAFQQVRLGDVVVHGLDGFAGAVGTSEADGICSPVYHVMEPRDGGDPDFYGRLLHVLAKTGYLSLFAVSTRERAVDFRNWDLFGRIPIPAVPPGRQREIGNRVRSLRPLRSAVARSRTLAIEHRQAVITAAISGELEIPGAA